MKRPKITTETGVDIILSNLVDNPCCPHGPTLLFSKKIKTDITKYYACSAQRDRKFCSFYLRAGEKFKNIEIWKQNALNFKKGINHRKKFLLLNEIKNLKQSERVFCSTCSSFVLSKEISKHERHKLLTGITDSQMMNPTKILSPCEVDKSEAQYWFSKSTIEDIVKILENLQYRFAVIY